MHKRDKKVYGIYSYSESTGILPVFWNNEMGWVDIASATLFSQEDKNTLNLPMTNGNDAHWCRLED